MTVHTFVLAHGFTEHFLYQSLFSLFSVFNQNVIEAKRMCQPQPTPAIQPDSTEDWESGIWYFYFKFYILRNETKINQQKASTNLKIIIFHLT